MKKRVSELKEWTWVNGKNADLEASVDETLLVELLEDPPHALHEGRIERLVVILEIDPPAQSSDDLLPFRRVSHHDLAALGVVLGNSQLEDVIASFNAKLFVDFKLDRQSCRKSNVR
jgi:hypothetical protein